MAFHSLFIEENILPSIWLTAKNQPAIFKMTKSHSKASSLIKPLNNSNKKSFPYLFANYFVIPYDTIPFAASTVTTEPFFNILVAFCAPTITGISKACPTVAA